MKRLLLAMCAVSGCVLLLSGVSAPPALEEGFRKPPMTAWPSVYYLWLNHYVNPAQMDKELEELKANGVGGVCIFDMGARGKVNVPPAGPAFLSDESLKIIGHAIRTATRLGMEVDFSVISSWDMGGSWVTLEDASKGLYHTSMDLKGPAKFSDVLPFPPVAPNVPKRADGMPEWYREVALFAIPGAQRLPHHEFIFELDPAGVHTVRRVVLYNGAEAEATREFAVDVSMDATRDDSFREVFRGTLKPAAGPQEFAVKPAAARFVRLRILSGGDPKTGRVQLAEFEVYGDSPLNLVASHEADRARTGSRLVRYTSALGQRNVWTADNIHDGVKERPDGTWSSAGPPPLVIKDPNAVLDLTAKIGKDGRLNWDVPAGNWTLLRFVCLPTGERLKVPSPNSDGWATDHLNADVTKRYMNYVISRLRKELGDFKKTTLKDLYLASYEVVGPIWTPDMPQQFRGYRGYDMRPYLPALAGHIVKDGPTTERFVYDYRKTLGDLLVDAYYRPARDAAHAAGLEIESEAGGPGPPIHQVPVDALKALGSVDSVRGEFWPRRPTADAIWVVKETAVAAHIYGKRRVHMEAFTSAHHFEDGPQDLKDSADRVFAEGANHMVWHTMPHLPPEAGKPGWMYVAGTHIGPHEPWWPMAKPFLDYLARASFLLQQGLFVGDVLYYYGDQGFNFVPPKHVDPSLGFGYDYDVVNPEVILTRLTTRGGKLVLPDGMSYEVMALPDREDMDLDVLRKVEQLIRDGATVVGPKPLRSNGLVGGPARDEQVRQLGEKIWGPCDGKNVRERPYGKGRVVCGLTLREVMKSRNVEPDFLFTSPRGDTRLDFTHRRTAEADIYFVRNMQARAERVEVSFRVKGKRPELWRHDTGEILEAPEYRIEGSRVSMPLELDPTGSVFVVFRRPAAGSRTAPKADPLPAPREVAGPWEVKFPEGWGAPPSVTLPKLISWTEHPNEGVRYFSGVARYEREIEIPAEWLGKGRKVLLDLGRVWIAAQVSLNGKPVGIAWKAPFQVDLTPAARPGKNRLEIAVANSWANRLIGDARAASGPRYTRTNITATNGIPWAKKEPLESGLFGPVRLLPSH